MSSASPFTGAAAYYHHRAPYAPEALAYVCEVFGLDRAARVLDLGCGPGKLAIPIARVVGEVVAVDPDDDMLAVARGADVANVRWVHGRAEDLDPALGRFQAVTMGQAFHWMERDRVLARLEAMVDGGIALLAPCGDESWEVIAKELAARYLGPRTRHPRANPDEPANEPALRRAAWLAEPERRTFELTITRDVASILGCVYSLSHSARPLFGDRHEAFERELTEALLAANPSGRFVERVDTEVVIATRRATPATARRG